MLPFLALIHSHSANVATFHAARDDTTGYALFGPILQGFFRKIHGLIAVSEVARDSIARYFPGDYRIIPNGIDLSRFHPDLLPLEKFRDRGPNILFVGRFDPRKGLRYLLQAFPYVLRRFPTARLIVVGQGMLKNIYRYFTDSEAKDSISFEGFVPNDMLPRYYASCDIFVSPATGRESFGIVLLEAMATGKAIVATKIAGYRTVVTANREALLVPPKNPRRLAAAIIRILKDPQLRNRLETQGRERTLRYSWPTVADEVESYYHEVLSEVSPVP
jgi:phosphatidylinositol alpha-mannosyltransferase